jgi:hypothetical protein
METHRPTVIKPRLPPLKRIIAYLAITWVVLLTATVPARNFLAALNRPFWTNPEFKATSADISAAVVWLAMANVSSFIVVWLLWRELRAVVKAAQGLHYKRSENPHLKIPGDVVNSELTNFVLSPLGLISVISIGVLLVTLGLSAALFLFGTRLHENVFFVAIIWTGFVYVLAMMSCDLAARKSYQRLCSLELVIPNDQELGPDYPDRARRAHRELLETLGDFDRMIFYVDLPVLVGVSIILLHKFTVLEPGAYYLGFIAGAVAMHTILANIISLAIAASSTVSLKRPT